MSNERRATFSINLLCLNPYSNGIYSMSAAKAMQSRLGTCLNPYSNGIYSMRFIKLFAL